MTEQTPTLHKYRVLYAVSRAEYYEIEAASESDAEHTAFEDGNLVRVGDTTDVFACETVEIAAFAPPMTEGTTPTTAPWHYAISANRSDVFRIFDDLDQDIAEVERWNGDGQDAATIAEAEANAALIAAAPAMREALISALKTLKTAPRFRVGDLDSYKIAAHLEQVLTYAACDS